MKKKLISTIMVCTLSFSAIALPIVAAADEFDEKIEQQDKKIQELNGKEASASEQLASVRSNIDSIKTKSEGLAKEQIKLGKEVTTLNEEITDLSDRIEKRDATIKEQARSMQKDGAKGGYLDIVLNAESISDVITKVTTANTLVKANDELMKQQETDKQAVVDKKATTEDKLETINQNAAELEAQKGTLMDQELQQTVLVNQIAAERETETGKKAEFQAKKEQAEQERAEQARQVAEAKRLAEVAKEQEAKAATVTPATGNSGEANNSPVVPEQPATPETGNGNEQPATPNPGNGNGGTVTPTPPPVTPAPPVTPTPPVTPPAQGDAAALVAEAYKHIGKEYTQDPGRRQGPNAFDCSGLMWYIFKQVRGQDIGGWTVPQESAGTQIPVSQAQAGDLLFWGSRGSTYHVALAIGGGQYIHAPTFGQTVTVGSISPYFAPSFAVRVN